MKVCEQAINLRTSLPVIYILYIEQLLQIQAHHQNPALQFPGYKNASLLHKLQSSLCSRCVILLIAHFQERRIAAHCHSNSTAQGPAGYNTGL
ncbi:hypothetical protein FKM82_015414 [Ascaphus truei]